MWRRDYLLSGFTTAIMLFCVSGYVFAGPGWSVEGEYFEGCTCNPGCPCLFGSEPTHNKTCKIAGVFHIQKDRITVRYLPISTESSEWRKKAVAGDRLLLDIELLHGAGDTSKPTQIVNKNFSIWAKEFDMTLDMGKATTHRFNEDKYEWNYDGRSGFATKFHFTSN